MSNRKNVSLRVSEHPQSHIINQWLDEQKNIQESLTNIIMHMIERFGIRNITDYDIQKLLYQDSSASNYVEGEIPPISPVQEKVLVNESTSEEKRDNKPKLEREGSTEVKVIQEEQEDDLYSDLDVTNL